jgi:hypothetical protein
MRADLVVQSGMVACSALSRAELPHALAVRLHAFLRLDANQVFAMLHEIRRCDSTLGRKGWAGVSASVQFIPTIREALP